MTTINDSDLRAVRDLIERWAHAVRDRDLAGIVAAHSADVLMFDVPEPSVVRGLDAYAAGWPPLFGWFGEHGVWNVRDVEIHAGTDVAFATALIDCHGKERLEVRLTVGLRKIDGAWTVVHEHHSVPST